MTQRPASVLVEEKFCSHCQQTKPWPEFYRSGSSKTGLSAWCRECDRVAHNLKSTAPAGQKFCTRCKTIKPIDEFGMNRTSRDGHQVWCKECHRDHDRAAILPAGGSRPDQVPAEKECATCHRILPWLKFNRSPLAKDGLQRMCRECLGLEVRSDTALTKAEPTIPPPPGGIPRELFAQFFSRATVEEVEPDEPGEDPRMALAGKIIEGNFEILKLLVQR